jgi:hypothetical protein
MGDRFLFIKKTSAPPPAPQQQQQQDETWKKQAETRKGACCSWHKGMQVAALVIAILTIALVGVSVLVSTKADSLYRACVETRLPLVGGEPGAQLVGALEFDSYDAVIRYSLQQAGATPMSGVQSLHIRGPLAPGDTDAPIYVALCGLPNLDVVCDTLTVPDAVGGIYRDAAVYIKRVRETPHLFYLEVLTSSFPASPGAARASLTNGCGFP